MEKPDWGQLGWSAAIVALGVGLMLGPEPWNLAGPLLILLGLLISLFALSQPLSSSSGYRSLQRRWRTWRSRRQKARYRREHESTLEAWERFYESWATAASYYRGAKDARLPVEAAWPWFEYHLDEAINAAEGLPGDHDSPKLWPRNLRRHLLPYLAQIKAESQQTSPPGGDGLEQACARLRDWLVRDHGHKGSPKHFILRVYRGCGLLEPAWPERVKTLSREALEASPPPTPPAAP